MPQSKFLDGDPQGDVWPDMVEWQMLKLNAAIAAPLRRVRCELRERLR
jgi:hypothetical protein